MRVFLIYAGHMSIPNDLNGWEMCACKGYKIKMGAVEGGWRDPRKYTQI